MCIHTTRVIYDLTDQLSQGQTLLETLELKRGQERVNSSHFSSTQNVVYHQIGLPYYKNVGGNCLVVNIPTSVFPFERVEAVFERDVMYILP